MRRGSGKDGDESEFAADVHLTGTATRNASSLLELQSRCKRDPESYHSDFIAQRELYSAHKAVIELDPAGSIKAQKTMAAVVYFLAQVKPL